MSTFSPPESRYLEKNRISNKIDIRSLAMPTNEIIMICIFSVLLIVFGSMLFCMFKIFNRNNKQDEQCIILTKNDLEKMFSKSYLAREKKNRTRFMFLLLFSFITTV